jgi:hypothetical protein
VDVPIVKILREEFGCPVHLENDANAGAVAEHRFGAGQGASVHTRVVPDHAGLRARVGPGRREVDRHPLAAEPPRDCLGQSLLVLCYQHAHYATQDDGRRIRNP